MTQRSNSDSSEITKDEYAHSAFFTQGWRSGLTIPSSARVFCLAYDQIRYLLAKIFRVFALEKKKKKKIQVHY